MGYNVSRNIAELLSEHSTIIIMRKQTFTFLKIKENNDEYL